MLSIMVEIGWPIPSWVRSLIEEQPKVKVRNKQIADLTNIDFIRINPFLFQGLSETQGSSSSLSFIFVQSLVDPPSDDLRHLQSPFLAYPFEPLMLDISQMNVASSHWQDTPFDYIHPKRTPRL